jgi:hypothetical protein
MGRSAAQKAQTRHGCVHRVVCKPAIKALWNITGANVVGSPVTPRRQHLLDLLSAKRRQNQDLLSRNAGITRKNENLVRRVNDLSRLNHNTSRRCNRSVQTIAHLRADLQRAKHNTVVLHGRVNKRKADGIARALIKARIGAGAHWMKGPGGIFTEQSREMVRDLVTFKVTPSNMDRVIHTVAKGMGLLLKDHISARQVGRMVEKGGIDKVREPKSLSSWSQTR